MPVEIKGQQLRIRIQSPKKFIAFRTKDVGRHGKLQLILGRTKSGKWQIQAYRMNLRDYKNLRDAIDDLLLLNISKRKYDKAYKLLLRWFK